MRSQWTSKVLSNVVRLHEFNASANGPAAARLKVLGQRLEKFDPREVACYLSAVMRSPIPWFMSCGLGTYVRTSYMSFSLPADVVVQRKPLSATSFEYIFRHHNLGELGRLILVSAPCGLVVTPVMFAPIGDVRNAQRKLVFEPLAQTLTDDLKKRRRKR